jgi:hypothetical protein
MQHFFVDSGRTTMSVCFNNSSCEFTSWFTQWQQLVLSIEEGEALQLLQATKEAKHRGFERIHFESDSQILDETIHTKQRGNSEFFSIVYDIILVMLWWCVNFDVKFIRRQVSSVAHALVGETNS